MDNDQTNAAEPTAQDPTFVAPVAAGRGAFRTALRATLAGNAVSQVLLVVAGLVVARYYGPRLLGVFATYSALTFALVPLANLRYSQAIPLAKEPGEARRILGLCCATSLVIPSIGMLAGVAVVATGGVSLGWVLAVGVGTALLSVQQSVGFYLAATGAFSRYAGSRVVYSGSLLVLQGALAPIASSSVSLIGAEFAASVLAIAWSFVGMPRCGVRERGTVARLRSTAREHVDFPRYQLPGGLMNAVSLQAPVVLVGAAFGSSAAGLYSIGYRLLYAPISLISQSVSAVFYPTIAKAAPAALRQRLGETARTLGLLCIGYVALLSALAPVLLGRLLGSRWDPATEIIWILGPMVVIYATTSAVSTVLLVRGRQRLLFGIQVLLLVTTVGPLGLPWLLDLSLLQALGVYSGAQALAYSLYFVMVARAARDEPPDLDAVAAAAG